MLKKDVIFQLQHGGFYLIDRFNNVCSTSANINDRIQLSERRLNKLK